jgi:hypothetical protein
MLLTRDGVHERNWISGVGWEEYLHCQRRCNPEFVQGDTQALLELDLDIESGDGVQCSEIFNETPFLICGFCFGGYDLCYDMRRCCFRGQIFRRRASFL